MRRSSTRSAALTSTITNHGPRLAWSAAVVAAARACAEQGLTRVETSAKIGVPYPTLYTLSKKHRIAFRNRAPSRSFSDSVKRAAGRERIGMMPDPDNLAAYYAGCKVSLSRW